MKLEQLVDFNPPEQLKRGELVPFIDMAALPTSHKFVQSIGSRDARGSGSRFRHGDTVFARITPCLENGKGAFISGLGDDVVGHGSTEFIVFRAKHKSDTHFVYYLSRHPDFRRFAEKRMSGTSGRQRVSWQSLASYEISEIAPDARMKIGEALAALDDKIELNRRMNETLEAMARAIFRDWFVDFGPTRAKMEGREPYLAPDLWALFPDRLDADGKPEGWEMGTAGQLIEFNPKEPLKKGLSAPYLSMSALPTSGAISEPPVPRSFTSGMRFRNGDTLFARITPCLENGKACFIQQLQTDEVGWGSTEFIIMRSRPPVPACFAYLMARDSSFRIHAIQSMAGTSGRQRARTEALESYPFCRPEHHQIWAAFSSIVSPLFEKIAANGGESQTLAATRDLLLPKLMSGEIRVAEAAELTDEAVARGGPQLEAGAPP